MHGFRFPVIRPRSFQSYPSIEAGLDHSGIPGECPDGVIELAQGEPADLGVHGGVHNPRTVEHSS